MNEPITYYRMPLCTNKRRCPVCGNNLTQHATCKIAFYSEESRDRKYKNCSVLSCNICSLNFLPPDSLPTIKVRKDKKLILYIPHVFRVTPGTSAKKIQHMLFSSESTSIGQSSSGKNSNIHHPSAEANGKVSPGKYETVPFGKENWQSVIHHIYLTNYPTEECILCHRRTMSYVNFIPTALNKALRIPGMYCNRCNIFIETNGLALKQALDTCIVADDIHISTDYILPSDKKIRALLKSIPSALLYVHLKKKNSSEQRPIVIVKDRLESESTCEKFYYTEPIARQLLLAVLQGKYDILLENTDYEICKQVNANNACRPIPLCIMPQKLALRTGGGIYCSSPQHCNKLVDILLFSPYTKALEVCHATKIRGEPSLFIDPGLLRRFIHRYGNPGIELVSPEHTSDDTTGWHRRQESLLHAYGYSVSANAGLSTPDRRELLSEILDLGYMSSKEITSLLRSNITSHSDDCYRSARLKWDYDINFVENYSPNPQRFLEKHSDS